MSDVMVDSSVWIQFFRSGQGSVCNLLDDLLEKDGVVICGVVEMELLRGVRPNERDRLKHLLGGLRFADILREDFTEAGERLCRLRDKGITIPATDALIAMLCKRNGFTLFTLDAHFKQIKEVRLLRW